MAGCPACGAPAGVHIADCSVYLATKRRLEAPPAPEARDVAGERKISDEASLMLAISKLEKILWELPLKIAFGAMASIVGKAVTASSHDDEKRRNNRAVFINTLDNVIRMEEEKVEFEANIRRKVDAQVEELQKKNPAANINRQQIELKARADARAQEAKKHAH